MSWTLEETTLDGCIEIEGIEYEIEIDIDAEGTVIAKCKEEHQKTRELNSIKGAMDDLECTLGDNTDDTDI